MLPRRYRIKLFESGTPQVSLPQVIPVFHRWIRENVLEQLLIDVADYKHVPGGPGILLVGFSSDYSFNEAAGRRGLTYVNKKGDYNDLVESLAASIGRLGLAAELLERAPELEGRIAFKTEELEIVFLDRLAIPAGGDSFRDVVPLLERALDRFEGVGKAVVSFAAEDPRYPLRVKVHLDKSPSVGEFAAYVRKLDEEGVSA